MYSNGEGATYEVDPDHLWFTKDDMKIALETIDYIMKYSKIKAADIARRTIGNDTEHIPVQYIPVHIVNNTRIYTNKT